MSTPRRSFGILTTVAAWLLLLAALPAITAAQPDAAGQACKRGGWQALAPEENPTLAFATQGDCVSYAAGGGQPVDLQSAPEHVDSGAESDISEDGPGTSDDAPGHDTDGPGNSEDAPGHASEAGAPEGAVSDAARACQQDGWSALAPRETPGDAFDSQADCIHYAAVGGVTVNVMLLGGAPDDCATAQAYMSDPQDLTGLDLSGCNLSGQDLSRAELTGADLSGADLHGAILVGADLYVANFEYADLTEADLTEADLTDADLTNADLSYADLSRATLSRAILLNTNLSHANLSHANLTGANLYGANLYRADLNFATLVGATLTAANLDRAILSFANLTGANLKGANLNTVIWTSTTCPDGTNSDADLDACRGHL